MVAVEHPDPPEEARNQNQQLVMRQGAWTVAVAEHEVIIQRLLKKLCQKPDRGAPPARAARLRALATGEHAAHIRPRDLHLVPDSEHGGQQAADPFAVPQA